VHFYRTVCAVHQNIVSLLNNYKILFPCELLPLEQLSVCATMNVTQLSELFAKDVSIHEVKAKWFIL